MKITFDSIIAVLGTAFSYLLGGWDMALKVLITFIVIDYISGLMKAVYNKEVSSSIGYKGLLKKGSIFLVLIVANLLDLATNANAPIFRTMACYFYIANEGISVLENLSMMEVPIPTPIKDMLEKMKKDNNEKSE